MRKTLLTALAAGVLNACTASALVAEPKLSDHDLRLLNRVTWGVSAPDAAELSRLGATRWLEAQLSPPPNDRLPARVQAEIDALAISKEPFPELFARMDAQRAAVNAIADVAKKKAARRAYDDAMNDLARQAAHRSLLRALYSPDQLKEQMTWFWFNQFNVYQNKEDIRASVGDYEDQAIRPHVLGKFRDLLEATLKHPAMLKYLDNFRNAADRPNENYARELLELHTMGVGSGYTQRDVQELARILTGLRVSTKPPPKFKPGQEALYVREGLFEFCPDRHDYGDKLLLGHVIKGSGFGEVEQALDILAREPATARRVSLRLATFFVGDEPPPALVERMAATFRQSDGDIASVLRTLFASAEFNASLGAGFKDPAHYVISSVRLAYGDQIVLDTRPMQRWMTQLGEGLYNRETPDGYPLTSLSWAGSGGFANRFDIARQLGAGEYFSGPGQMAPPAPPSVQNALYQQGVEPTLGAPTRGVLEQARSPREWNALYLSSPDFMRR